jgi:purine-binding chemotaxis protein CheW
VTYVHSVIPELLVKSSPLDGRAVRGVVRLGDDDVPVVDPLSFLGLGALPPHGADRGVAVSFARGIVVLAVSDVVRIVPAPASAVLPLPDSGLPASAYLGGILSHPGSDPYLLLDGEAIRASDELAALAALGISATGGDAGKATFPGGASDDREGTVQRVVRKYLTYNGGTDVATPLAYITEILPYPGDLIPISWANGSVRGVFVHRGTAIPLVCMPTLLGRGQPADGGDARVLLIETSKGYVGFAVRTLRAIEQSVWEQPAAGEPQIGALLGTSPLVEVGDGEQNRMLPNIDLRAVASSVW